MYTGNTLLNGLAQHQDNGLSLCIQGTHSYSCTNHHERRFIPVYTGNTFVKQKRLGYQPVYPCVYREHNSLEQLLILRRGLSLCIQGTLPNGYAVRHFSRFIPVYTGNTSDNPSVAAIMAVYPCVYREHTKRRMKIDR